MKIRKIATLIILLCCGGVAFAQELPTKLIEAIREDDDAARLADFINPDNINNCLRKVVSSIRFYGRR